MIIDDDDLIRRALTVLLGKEYDVQSFRHATDALAFLRGGARPFALLVDASMAGMSGYEFRAEQLRDASLATIPAILMTGNDLPPDPASSGFDVVIAKPFSSEELVPVLRRFARTAVTSAG